MCFELLPDGGSERDRMGSTSRWNNGFHLDLYESVCESDKFQVWKFIIFKLLEKYAFYYFFFQYYNYKYTHIHVRKIVSIYNCSSQKKFTQTLHRFHHFAKKFPNSTVVREEYARTVATNNQKDIVSITKILDRNVVPVNYLIIHLKPFYMVDDEILNTSGIVYSRVERKKRRNPRDSNH